MNKKRQFAFWIYDQFPYVLGAEVKEIFYNGCVEPFGYEGFRFSPLKIMNYNEGKMLWIDIQRVKEEKITFELIMQKYWQNRLNEAGITILDKNYEK